MAVITRYKVWRWMLWGYGGRKAMEMMSAQKGSYNFDAGIALIEDNDLDSESVSTFFCDYRASPRLRP